MERDLRALLLSAAVEELAESGIADFRPDVVAEAVGTSPEELYANFGDRAALVVAASTERAALLADQRLRFARHLLAGVQRRDQLMRSVRAFETESSAAVEQDLYWALAEALLSLLYQEGGASPRLPESMVATFELLSQAFDRILADTGGQPSLEGRTLAYVTHCLQFGRIFSVARKGVGAPDASSHALIHRLVSVAISGPQRVADGLGVAPKDPPSTLGISADTVRSEQARVLDAACELLLESSPLGFSVADLARRLGVSQAAVLQHFESRSQLLGEAGATLASRLQDAVGELVDPVALSAQTVAGLVEAGSLSFMSGEDDLFDLMRRTALTGLVAAEHVPQAMVKINGATSRLERKVGRYVATWQDRGLVDETLDSHLVASFLVRLNVGRIYFDLDSATSLDPDTLRQLGVVIYRDLLAPRT